jgi:hypothetical protein
MTKHIMELIASLVDDAKVAGIKAERERIIKVIENECTTSLRNIVIPLIEEGIK